MDRARLGKRDFLRFAGATGAAMLAARASAQNLRILEGLGQKKLPDQLLSLLPEKEQGYVALARSLLALEKEADLRQLPQSLLARGSGTPIAELDDGIYQVALPRLVALIDRSELREVGLADRAGELLAELHKTQHAVPEALRTDPLSVGLAPYSPAAVPRMAAVAEGEGGGPSRARDFPSLKGEYRRFYETLSIRPERSESAQWHLDMIRQSRPRYERCAARAEVPWFFVAVIHALESSFNFRAHLHNGDFPLSTRTRQVPAGRPKVWLPPSDWESSATDAMRLLGFSGQSDWSLERTLHRLEAYNGFGYRGLGVATPYLWNFSQHYERGKFVADGRFNASARSQQCGAAVMLHALERAGDMGWSGSA